MPHRVYLTLLLFGLVLLPLATRGQAQPLQIEGRVVDASTGASLPSTNISIGGHRAARRPMQTASSFLPSIPFRSG